MSFRKRDRFHWRLRSRRLDLGERTLVMGIVNATPDSFSDGGSYDPISQGLRLIDEGADILDVGGESTRPGGAGEVTAEEEQRRVLPVIEALARAGAPVSVDTYRASTARLAIEAGAEIVNDVSGLMWDEAMAITCADLRCGVVVMHTRGRPAEWKTQPPLDDVTRTVMEGLRQRLTVTDHAGIERERIVLDPGFGFGKRGDENFDLLAGFAELQNLGMPLLAGASRKGFLSALPAHLRDVATVAAHTAAVLAGAHIVRVHDVRSAIEGVRVADALLDKAES